MDDYSGKRALDRGLLSRKESGFVLRDAANNRDQNTQLRNRLGCSGSVNSPKGDQKGGSEKGKSLRPSNRSSSSGKDVVGASFRASLGSSNPRKLLKERKKTLSLHLETASSETGCMQDEPELLEIAPHPEKILAGLPAVSEIAPSSNAIVLEVGSSVASKKRPNTFNPRTGLLSQDAVAGSYIPSRSRSSGHMPHTATNRYGLKNFRCNSISDVFPPGCSSSDSNLNRKKSSIKKVSHDVEGSSSARGKKIIGSTFEGRNVSSRNGISITESRRSRNAPPNRDTMVTSLRTRRANTGQSRARLSNQGNEDSVSLNGGPFMISPTHSDDLNTASLSLHISSDAPTGRAVSYGRPGSSSEHSISPTSPEFSISRSLLGRENIRRYNMSGIAEVLLALERVEHDQELTHEQILVLETNLLLNSLSFYDQHRDMRLDIDNMSYEELLALEERMGTVSTALTEEALAESLKKSVFQSAQSNVGIKGCCGDDDDNKCSICQEEYALGDEVGSLHCEHRYHTSCIQQWLGLKNWCPTCKASAAPPKSSPPS